MENKEVNQLDQIESDNQKEYVRRLDIYNPLSEFSLAVEQGQVSVKLDGTLTKYQKLDHTTLLNIAKTPYLWKSLVDKFVGPNKVITFSYNDKLETFTSDEFTKEFKYDDKGATYV